MVLCPNGVQEDREQGLRDPDQEVSRQVRRRDQCTGAREKSQGRSIALCSKKAATGENHASNLKNAQKTLLPFETNEA